MKRLVLLSVLYIYLETGLCIIGKSNLNLKHIDGRIKNYLFT
jgi:hypothetical protein